MPELTLLSPAETEAAGASLAAALPAVGQGACIFLNGELGAGKTTFTRGLLRGLGHAGRVPSPTYTLVEPYEFEDRRIWHLDLYRLGDAAELDFLGLDEMAVPGAVILVEWPERGKGYLPSSDLVINLQVVPEGRLLRIQATSGVGEVLLAGFVPPAKTAAETK